MHARNYARTHTHTYTDIRIILRCMSDLRWPLIREQARVYHVKGYSIGTDTVVDRLTGVTGTVTQ